MFLHLDLFLSISGPMASPANCHCRMINCFASFSLSLVFFFGCSNLLLLLLLLILLCSSSSFQPSPWFDRLPLENDANHQSFCRPKLTRIKTTNKGSHTHTPNTRTQVCKVFTIKLVRLFIRTMRHLSVSVCTLVLVLDLGSL